MFTEFKFDKEMIKEVVLAKAATLKANKGFSDFAGYAIGVVARRIEKDPLRYRDYGPYWWAVKLALKSNGRVDYGDSSDPVIAAEYVGSNSAETMVMADLFRDWHLKTHAVGNNQFMLDSDSGDTYTLDDPDMEVPA